jgi:hypothetical protein
LVFSQITIVKSEALSKSLSVGIDRQKINISLSLLGRILLYCRSERLQLNDNDRDAVSDKLT